MSGSLAPRGGVLTSNRSDQGIRASTSEEFSYSHGLSPEVPPSKIPQRQAPSRVAFRSSYPPHERGGKGAGPSSRSTSRESASSKDTRPLNLRKSASEGTVSAWKLARNGSGRGRRQSAGKDRGRIKSEARAGSGTRPDSSKKRVPRDHEEVGCTCFTVQIERLMPRDMSCAGSGGSRRDQAPKGPLCDECLVHYRVCQSRQYCECYVCFVSITDPCPFLHP